MDWLRLQQGEGEKMAGSGRRILIGLLCAFLLTVLAFVSGGCVSAATTYYVNPGESIQAAVTAAGPGDTIIVRDGTYTENVEVNVANLTLRSEHGSAFTTVVAAVNTSDVFLVTANSVTITGFTVRNASAATGIHLHSVHHCTIAGNNALGNHYGIWLYSASNNNTLTDNTANSNNNYGIYLSHLSNNNTLTGNIAANNTRGIYLRDSNTTTLMNNTASNNSYGIYLISSCYNTLTGNTVNSNNGDGIFLDSSSNNNTLIGNTANSNNNKGMHLWSSSYNYLTSNTALNNYNGILLYYSSYNTLTDNTASNNSVGIWLGSSSYNTLTDNTASNNSFGINLEYSSKYNNLKNNTAHSNNNYGIYLRYLSINNTLTGNIASNNSRGIFLRESSNTTLTSNTANSNSQYGVYLLGSSTITMTDNIANSNDEYGILLYSASNNTLSGNTVLNNYYGISLESSNNNLIYNNYLDNTQNAYAKELNIWNISKTPGTNIIGGSYLGGNYWSDYKGEDNDDDGLGNTLLPYIASGDIQYGGDWLPLVKADQPGKWDINEDCTVNFIDLTILSAHWLETTTAPFPRYDINEDGVVNFIDLTILSAHWLETTC